MWRGKLCYNLAQKYLRQARVKDHAADTGGLSRRRGALVITSGRRSSSYPGANAAIKSDYYPAAPGPYTLSYYYRAYQAQASMTVQLFWFDDSFYTLGSTVLANRAVPVAGAWTLQSYNTTAPPNTTQVRIWFADDNPGVQTYQNLSIDDVTFALQAVSLDPMGGASKSWRSTYGKMPPWR